MPSRSRLATRPETSTRRGRPARPTCEALEGRALMAVSIFDPTFGAAGFALGPADTGADVALGNASAVAVQADGKVVTAGVYRTAAGGSGVGVRRLNADGTVDAGFGVGGQANIPLPAGATGVATAPHDVAIKADGSIVLAAGLSTAAGGVEGMVVQLTADGNLDTNYATVGRFVVPAATGTLSALALQGDGSVVAAGASAALGQILVVRLTPGGALDPSFNTTGQRAVPFSLGPGVFARASVALTTSGQVYAVGSYQRTYTPRYGYLTASSNTDVIRLDADGTPDATFGTGGLVAISPYSGTFVNDIAVQADGRAILAGLTMRYYNYAPFLARLGADGTVDPTFAGVNPDGTVLAAPTSPGQPLDSVAVAADGTVTVSGNSQAGSEQYGRLGVRFYVQQFRPDGTPNPGFGKGGLYTFAFPPSVDRGPYNPLVGAVALKDSGEIVVAGSVLDYATLTASGAIASTVLGSRSFVAELNPAVSPTFTNLTPLGDYFGDGSSDFRVLYTDIGAVSLGISGESFGVPGVGQTIPAPGDYDGDGRTDVAAYLPATGVLDYRPSSGGPDVLTPFGAAGAGNSIPAPGDYDGDGKADVAVYLPQYAVLAYRPSSNPAGGDVLIPFGVAGTNQSIPAPGDYDGDGKTDVAAYLPQYGVFAYRPSSGGPDVLTPFGAPGDRASIPAPGDYDGDGKTDLAVYLTQYAIYAYRPSSGGADVLTSFGAPGVGLSIPAPGDYDGDGRTDLAVYLPTVQQFAYRSSLYKGDRTTPYGTAGVNESIPLASIPYALPGFVSASALRGPAGPAAAAVDLALTDDLLATLTGTPRKRPS